MVPNPPPCWALGKTPHRCSKATEEPSQNKRKVTWALQQNSLLEYLPNRFQIVTSRGGEDPAFAQQARKPLKIAQIIIPIV